MITDLRLAWRMFRRGRGASLLAVAMLALAMAGTLTLYTVLTAMTTMWPALPDRGSLARIYAANVQLGVERDGIPWTSFAQWPAALATFDTIAFTADAPAVEDLPDVAAQQVTGRFFDVLQIRSLAGRLLTEADDRDGARVAVVSDRLARSKHGAAADAIGNSILLGRDAYTIIGVASPEFFFPTRSNQIWIPIRPDGAAARRGVVIGRLKAGRTWSEAAAELAALARGANTGTGTAGWTIKPIPLDDDQSVRARNGLIGLLSPALAVLLIACVNATNLMLSRAMERAGEFRIRLALGASRGRIARQLLVEGALNATIGTLAGVLLSIWGIRVFRSVVAGFSASSAEQIVFSSSTLLAALVIATATPLLISVLPAITASRRHPSSSLNEVVRPTRGRSGYGPRDALVFVEVALASILVVMALMVFRLFGELRDVHPRFDPARVVVGGIAPDISADDLALLVERVRGTAGVETVATINGPLLATGRSRARVSASATDEGVACAVAEVSSDYFKTLRLPLLAGRPFEPGEPSRGVAIVSATVAERLWGARRLPPGSVTLRTAERASQLEIVGIVEEATAPSALASLSSGSVYLPRGIAEAGPVSLLARTSGAATTFTEPLSKALSDLSVAKRVKWRPLADAISFDPRDSALMQWLLAMFSALALTLAAGGVFAVSRHAVLQRTREFGVRLALGATPAGLVRMVIGHEMQLVVVAIVLAAAGTLAVTYYTFLELVQLATRDPFFWVRTLVALGGASTFACYAAARRISRLAPMEALRDL